MSPVQRGPMFTVGKMTYAVPDVVEEINNAVGMDDTDSLDVSQKLIEVYRTQTPEQRAAVDRFLIELCGWDFSHLLEEAGMSSELFNALGIEVPTEEPTEEDEEEDEEDDEEA